MSEEQEIPGGDLLWRRVNIKQPCMMRYDSVTQEELGPSSAAFKPHDDGTSVYVRRILDECEVGLAEVSENSHDSIWELESKSVRDQDLDVISDAWPQDVPDPGHLRNAAHALIVGWEGLGRKQVDKKAKALARLASCVHHPEKRTP
ncbi:hypothetical protein [Streptomyces lasiicapitis]|uniref:Uncharacterized protein n=1 Tax=Streptomyces lasiicapitis TaxID=1923961 RepID=A0ABQ2M6P4_9ACTN|nr:hypothetical protein [Streptomyces lasiicapitis]GGO47560.1 hypothetical protein GCM10012286_41140 [Streptomyces lasiicapitis]